MSSPTIIDVADACRVSPSTVSLVLSDNPRISLVTKLKVKKKIDEMGYRPNHVARSLVRGATNILAVLIPPVENVFSDPFYAQALDGVYSIAKNSGYRIILEVGTEQFWENGEYEKLLSDGLAAGVIFCGGVTPEHRRLAETDARSRCVIVGEYPTVPRRRGKSLVSCVSGDNFKGGYLAAKHLLKLGHKKIAHIHGDLKVFSVSERFRGYQKAMDEAGIPFDIEIVANGHFSEWHSYLCAKSFFSRAHPPTAIFAGNDIMAFGAVRAAVAAGLKTPRDVSVVGMDDIPAAADFSPPLTTVRYPVFSMGAHAASSLIKSVEAASPRRVGDKIFDVSLVVRKSSAPPPRDKK